MRALRDVVAVLAVVLSGTHVSTDSQDVPDRQGPHFCLGVDLVEVDVVITGEDGRPVQGLAIEDFQLREDNVQQEIAFFEPATALATPGATRAEPDLLPDVQTNAISRESRLIVIVLDTQVSLPNTGRVRHFAREFVTKYLSSDDLAAVVVAGAEAKGWEFTSDKKLLLTGVDSFVGESPGRVLDTLKSVANHLAPIRGRRKVLVLFTQGFTCEVDDSLSCPDNPTLSTEVRDAIGAITRAGVSIYPVDIRGLTGPRDESITEPPLSGAPEPVPGLLPRAAAPMPGVEIRGLRAFAARTGGIAFVNSNDFEGGFDRIRLEAGSYYLLGYYPTNRLRSGGLRRIDVRVRRPNVEVRARKVYEETRGERPKTAPAIETENGDDVLVALARAPLPVHQGLGLAIQAISFGNRDSRGVVTVVVDIAGRDLAFTDVDGLSTNQLRWLICVTDRAGTVVARDEGSAELRLTPERAALVRDLGTRLASSLDVPPGRHRIRVAVQDNTGRAGSLFAHVEVPEVDDRTLGLSGILLTSGSASAVPAVRRLADLPLPALPTTRRTFSQDDTLALAVHIKVPAADGVIVTTTLTNNGGSVQQRFEDRYKDEGAQRSSHLYVKNLSLNDVPPGSYLLEIHARTISSGAAALTRRLALEVTPGGASLSARQNSEAGSSAGLAALLERAGERIVEYERELSSVVAEEHYVQDSVFIGGPRSRASGGRRILRSDILLVRAPGAIEWTAFRDVFEVNGKPVRDRDSRLTKLFLEPSETNVSQARRILDESARYNIGPIRRNINVPTTALLVLHPDYQRRFRFKGPSSANIGDVPAWEIEFHEIGRPTVVTSGEGQDLPMRGRLWLDSAWMQVVKTELELDDRSSLHVRTEVAYGYAPGIGSRLPLRMEERYESRRLQNRIHGVAEYSNFRRFRVVTDEKARVPGRD
jgi:VWFA-related protein